MQSANLAWGLIVIIAVLTVLSVSIIAGVLMYSRKIREQEVKFRLLFNKVSDALIVFSKAEQIAGINESACNLLGYSRQELVKLNLKDILVKDKWLELHEQFGKIGQNSDKYRGESKLVNNNGKVIDVEVIGVNIKLNGESHILASFRDITLRKRNELQLRKKHIALQEVLTYLEDEKLKIKQQVAKTVDQVLMPALNRLEDSSKETVSTYYSVLKDGLHELSSASDTMVKIYSKLTPREIEICNLIKSGATSKEIAGTLNISMLTVNKHRERIRRKLVISNKNINLTSFLKHL